MKQIANDIKNNEFKKTYLIYGEEDYLVKQYRDKLKVALVGDDTLNYAYYEGDSINIEDLISTCETMPFFSDRKTVIVENSNFFKKANDRIADYIKKLPDYLVLIFIERDVDKRNKVYKAVNSIGYICEMTFQSTSVLKKWIGTLLKSKGIKITEEACEEIIMRTGANMDLIKMELDKLESYCANSMVVTIDDVCEIVTVQTETNIFSMIEAIANHSQDKALDLYYELLANKEPPMRILYLIVRQFNGILQVKELNGQHMSSKDIASAMKIAPFIVGKYLTQSKNFTLKQIKEALSYFADIEENVKRGTLNDRMGVELAIIKYSSERM